MLRIGRIGERTEHVEHARHTQCRANRSDEAHGGVEHTCEGESDAAFVADPSHLFRGEIKWQTKLLEAVGGAAFGGRGTIAMLNHLDAGRRGNHRSHG